MPKLIRFALFDAGHKIGVLIGTRKHNIHFKFRNPLSSRMDREWRRKHPNGTPK